MHPARLMVGLMAVAALLAVVVTGFMPSSAQAAAADGGQAHPALLTAHTGPVAEQGPEIHARPAAQAADEEDDDLPTGFYVFLGLSQLIITVILMIAGWRIYTKAGRSGWLAIIPIVNAIVLLSIVGRPWWWIILYLIPIVGFITWLVVSVDLAKAFRHSTAFGIILIGILQGIGMLILGFGDDQYAGPARA